MAPRRAPQKSIFGTQKLHVPDLPFRGSVGGQPVRKHPKIHSKIQIRTWELRGQNPHCKDPALTNWSRKPEPSELLFREPKPEPEPCLAKNLAPYRIGKHPHKQNRAKIHQKYRTLYFLSIFDVFLGYFEGCCVFLSCRGPSLSQTVPLC